MAAPGPARRLGLVRSALVPGLALRGSRTPFAGATLACAGRLKNPKPGINQSHTMLVFFSYTRNLLKPRSSSPLPFTSIMHMSQSTSIPKKQDRVRDHGFDNYMEAEKKTRKVLKFQSLILSQPSQTLPISRFDSLARRLGLGFKENEAAAYLLKFPHVFEIYEHPVLRILFCRLTQKALLQIEQEKQALHAQLPDVRHPVKEVGYDVEHGPFETGTHTRNKYIEIVERDPELAIFWKWQRVPYWSPYENVSGYDLRSLEALKRMEKRAVATIHELLSLTVEKKISLERIAHFRMAMNLPKKLKDFLLQHQGIFYVSTRGNYGKLHTVFLREAYRKGELTEPNDLYLARRKLGELVLLSSRKAMVDKELVSYRRDTEVDDIVCVRPDYMETDLKDFGVEYEIEHDEEGNDSLDSDFVSDDIDETEYLDEKEDTHFYVNGLLKKPKASIVQFFLPVLVTNARCWWKFQQEEKPRKILVRVKQMDGCSTTQESRPLA
ncbi:hypothetical protein GOBAR_AA38333 [Gossypium barbadense]|uniref:PORR domain-containing protein n=1 Tax=Gossypium barbadense TaxID=3634 RepID=A0A2P5VU67_GOSBA|nr:hypothetical protein GOBAR_AA38333 [Gossypium barbadense]